MIEDIDLDIDTSLVQPHAAEDDTFNWEEAFPLSSDAAKKLNLTERDESAAEDFHFVTPTKISASGEAYSLDISPEDQLGVLSATKILADVGKSDTVPKTVSEVQTYIRRRDVIDVNTGSEAVNIASDFFSAAKASVNNVGDSILVKDKDPCQREGKAVMDVNEIIKKFKKGEYKQISQEQEKNDLEKALELQK
ncbi:hypothetical protein Tco_0029069 [Tanacetum coccineum]